MSSFPPNRATTLKAAFRACYVGPLSGEEIKRYYVDLSAVRRTEAIEGVNRQLNFLESGEFETILFTGHRGCGKSTELRRIQKQWESDYLVIYSEVDLEADIQTLSYIDLYLIIIKQVEYELRKKGLKFDSKLLKKFEDWFKEVTKETEEKVERSVSATGSLEVSSGPVPFIAKLMVKLLAQIKGSQTDKQTIRQTLERDLSRLQTNVNELLVDGLEKLQSKFPNYKGFLIIFDNMDRLTPDVANTLFFDNALQLQQIKATIIYTVPISVIYSVKNLSNDFLDSPNIMPMVNIYQFNREAIDLEYDPEGLAAVASIIEQRVDIEAVFEDREPLLQLAQNSGGHVRQLMQIMRNACLTASTREHPKITVEDVTYATKQEQFNFERSIRKTHYPVLARVCVDKEITEDEIGQLALSNISILEYNGNQRWNYVNPLVKPIRLFQDALKIILEES